MNKDAILHLLKAIAAWAAMLVAGIESFQSGFVGKLVEHFPGVGKYFVWLGLAGVLLHWLITGIQSIQAFMEAHQDA